MMINQAMITLGILVIALIINSLVKRFITRYGQHRQIPHKRIYFVKKYFALLMLAVTIIAVSLVWSFNYHGLLVFASSLFAIIGIALFAEWSVLSNITSTVIIFFSLGVGIGDKIRIVDGDNSITGTIRDITLFHISLIDDEQNDITYPNKLLLQKPVIKLKLGQVE